MYIRVERTLAKGSNAERDRSLWRGPVTQSANNILYRFNRHVGIDELKHDTKWTVGPSKHLRVRVNKEGHLIEPNPNLGPMPRLHFDQVPRSSLIIF
jgi:hypothetical protein